MNLMEKLTILSDAAKYDVSCSSSGSTRRGNKNTIGSAAKAGICHSFAADGRCISLLKILMTNHCIYDCAYCLNRKSNDTLRAAFTVDEIVSLTMNFYRRNYIEGLFLSSAIIGSPDYTMEQMVKVVERLRCEEHFYGYIHLKAIPGANPILIQRAGELADRLSVNLELPSEQSLSLLAPEKTRQSILLPMQQIHQGITAHKQQKQVPLQKAIAQTHAPQKLQLPSITKSDYGTNRSSTAPMTKYEQNYSTHTTAAYKKKTMFVPAGQTTQMIVGASGENDLQMLQLTAALYKKFEMKRVYFSAYIPLNEDNRLPQIAQPPMIRENRLYQADWLMRFYGFEASELLDTQHPNFDPDYDPKLIWAIRHPEAFPVDVNTASYQQLIRVPGLGIQCARRIISARRTGKLDFADLLRMHVSLKRAQYFLTCNGKYYQIQNPEPQLILHALKPNARTPYQQLTLF